MSDWEIRPANRFFAMREQMKDEIELQGEIMLRKLNGVKDKPAETSHEVINDFMDDIMAGISNGDSSSE